MRIIGLPKDQMPPRTDANCDWIVYVNNREYLLFEDEYEALKIAIQTQQPHFWSYDKSFGIRPNLVSDEVPIKHQKALAESPIDFYSEETEYTPEEREQHRRNFEEIKKRAMAIRRVKQQKENPTPEDFEEAKKELENLHEMNKDTDLPF